MKFLEQAFIISLMLSATQHRGEIEIGCKSLRSFSPIGKKTQDGWGAWRLI